MNFFSGYNSWYITAMDVDGLTGGRAPAEVTTELWFDASDISSIVSGFRHHEPMEGSQR